MALNFLISLTHGEEKGFPSKGCPAHPQVEGAVLGNDALPRPAVTLTWTIRRLDMLNICRE